MRALLLALLLVGCTKSEATVTPEAAKAEATPAAVAQQPGAVAFPQTVPAAPAPATEDSCGGGSCCGGGGTCCGGAMADTATIPSDAPATASWSTVKVSMRCGKCAKKIMAALGKVEGIIAVQADFESGQVRWAVDQGRDVPRDTVIAEIRKLGYQPQL